METDINISEVNPNPDHDRMPDPFEMPIQGFVFTREQMEDYIRKHLEAAMKEMGLNMRDMALRGGNDEESADPNGNGRFLETVFEYDDMGRGIYEDEVLRYLEKYHPLALEGVRVRFRPLNDKQTGSLDDYWKNFIDRLEAQDRKDKKAAAALSQYQAVHNDDVPEPPPPRTDNPNDTHNLDYQSKIDVDIYQDYADPEAAMKARGDQGVPFSKDEISQIAAALGTTTDFKQGGWILPDGRILRFIRDGIRRKEQDIGIGFTEERKHRISNEVKQRLENLKPHEHKQEGTGPYDINGVPQSQVVDPWGSLAEKTYPEAFPLEAIRGGLIRYALSSDGSAIEIDAYHQPTQGQMDALEDVHEWIEFVNQGGYDRNEREPEPTIERNEELTYTQQEVPQTAPTGQDAGLVDEDDFERVRRERQEHAQREMDSASRRFNGENPRPAKEDIPKTRLIVVYVGSGDDDWWDYDTVDDVKRNLVKDLRTYWRDGKKPNEDFQLPEEDEEYEVDAYGEKVSGAQDEALGFLKARNADIFPKRIYRPRTTLLKQLDYRTARRIVRENVSLIKTIPMLDILDAEKKVLAYFRLKLTRDQLARYFYKVGNGAITKAWAGVIADDQINKASERLRVAKWRKNGVKMVRWVHCNLDEPRPYHKEKWNGASGIFDGFPNGLNGFVFPLDFPPIIDPKTGERGYPAQLINCRCHLEPVY